jgi:UDP-2-acetamido-3-amino-2,3-dideoxy-glucuronate N-acetyltransferase
MVMAEKQHIAVVGCGYWGRNLVRNMAELGALAAVSDTHTPNAGVQAKQYSVPARAFEDILADKHIEGVVIAAPAVQHAALATRALEAGKHVFVEKPLALNVKDAEMLAKLATGENKVLMVGHLLQYHPAYLTLKEMAGKGEFGELTYIASSRLNLGKLRTEENVLWSFAPHDISMVLGLFGEAPREVSAQGTAALTPGIADIVTAQLEFAQGKAQLFVSWLHPVKEQKFIVVGSKAMAVFDDSQGWESKLTLYRHRIEWNGAIPSPVKAEGEKVALAPAEPLKEECRHFIAAIAGNPVRTDATEGINVLKVLEAAERSMATGKPARLDRLEEISEEKKHADNARVA